MKKRQARTFEHAITRIIGELTDEGAGEAVGKSAALVWKWANPDSDSLPNLKQAITLDLAYLEQGGRFAPIMEVYQRNMEAAGLSVECSDIIGATLSLTTTMGQLTAAVQAAKAPTGPGGTRINGNEADVIKKAVDRVKRQLNEIDAALNSPALKEVG